MSDKIDKWVPVSERLPDYNGDNDWCIVTSVTGNVCGALIDSDGSLPGWAIAWLDEPLPAAYVPPREVGLMEALEASKTHWVMRSDRPAAKAWFRMCSVGMRYKFDCQQRHLELSDLTGKFIIGERHTEDSNAPA